MIRTDELLTTAAFRGETERVRAMLDHGASASSRSAQTMCTALHWAVSMGHVEVAEVSARARRCGHPARSSASQNVMPCSYENASRSLALPGALW